MTLSVLRPIEDAEHPGIVFSTGSTAWNLLDDGGAVTDYSGADDTTYVRTPAGKQYPSAHLWMRLTDLASLASTQRIKAVRVRGRVRMNTSVAGDAAIIQLRLWDHHTPAGPQPVAALDEWVTGNASVYQPKVGPWHTQAPKSVGPEWTRGVLNRLVVHVAWFYGKYGNENLRLSELYLDVDVRDAPQIGELSVEDAAVTTRPHVAWSFTPNADDDLQTAYHVRVFSQAQYSANSFDPGHSPAVWSSGVRRGGVALVQVGKDLRPGATYQAYVRAAADFNGSFWWTDWSSTADFTVTPTPPPAPALTVAPDPSLPWYRNILSLTSGLNLLSDADASLETGLGRWVAVENVALGLSTAGIALDGQAVLLVDNFASPNPWSASISFTDPAKVRWTAIPVTAATQYTAVLSVRAQSATHSVVARIYWFTSTGALLANNDGTPATDATATWTQVSVTATAPTGARYAAVAVAFPGAMAVGEKHYVDRVGMWTGNSTAWDPTTNHNLLSATQSSFESGLGQWWSPWQTLSRVVSGAADGIQALAMTATAAGDMTAATAVSPNQLSADDSGLEATVGNWVGVQNVTSAARSTAQFFAGAASLAVTCSGAGAALASNSGGGGLPGAILVTPGSQYTASGYARAAATARGWRLQLRWYDSAGNLLTSISGATATDSTSGWTALPALSGFAPDTAVKATVAVESTTTPAAAEVHYFDQFRLGPSPDPVAGGVPVVPATTYTAVASFQANTVVRQVRVRVTWFDVLGVQIGSPVDGTAVTDTVGAFTLASVTATSPAGARNAVVTVQVLAAAAGEIHLVDKIGIWPGSSTVWSFGGQIDGTGYVVVERNWAGVTPTNLIVPQLWSGGDETQTADGFFTDAPALVAYDPAQRVHGQGSVRLDVVPATNRLSADDAGAEGTVGNWTPAQNVSGVARSTSQAAAGLASVAITASGAGPAEVDNRGNQGAGQMVVSAGQQLTATGKIRAATSGRPFRLGIRFTDTNLNNVYGTSYGATVTDSSSGWLDLPAVFATVPAGAVRAYVVVGTTATPAGGEVHYADTLTLALTGGLYLGWPGTPAIDPDPDWALAGVPGLGYTCSLYARAAPDFASRLDLQALDKDGNVLGTQSGAAITIGAAWTRFATSWTLPAGTVWVRPKLVNTGGVITGSVWVDGAQWELCPTATDLAHPGGQPALWFPVRGAGEFATDLVELPVGQLPIPVSQQVTVMDHEVPAGYTVSYRAKIVTLDNAGNPVASDWSPYLQTRLDPPGQGHWILSSVTDPSYRMDAQVVSLEEGRAHEVSVYHPLRPDAPQPHSGTRSVAIGDFIGGIDGQLVVATTTEDEWLRLDRMLRTGSVLWVAFGDFGGRYLRVTGQPWSRQRLPVPECATCPPVSRFLRQLTVPVVEVGPPR